MLVLDKEIANLGRESGEVRVAVSGLLSCLPPKLRSFLPCCPGFHYICAPPSAPPPSISGGFTSMCLLHAGPKRTLGVLLFTPLAAAVVCISLSFLFPLLGLTLMWNALASLHLDLLSALFSLHDFICSKYVEIKKKKK